MPNGIDFATFKEFTVLDKSGRDEIYTIDAWENPRENPRHHAWENPRENPRHP